MYIYIYVYLYICISVYLYKYIYIYILYHFSLETHGPWSGIPHDLRDTTWNQNGGETICCWLNFPKKERNWLLKIICHPYLSYTLKYPTIRFPWYPTIYANTFKISWLSQCISHSQFFSYYIYIHTLYYTHYIYNIYIGFLK